MAIVKKLGARRSGPVAQKYTEGHVFHRDPASDESIRRVAERACTAVSTLLQDVFVSVEKHLVQRLAGDRRKKVGEESENQLSSEQQTRLLATFSDVVSARFLLEKSVLSAVVCAFSTLSDELHGREKNKNVIEEELAYFKTRDCERYDLYDLLQVESKIAYNTNSSRPLLVHLNAQLVRLIKEKASHVRCCPLSPAVFLGGFVMGLQCLKADIASKGLLLQFFEQEFLSRLSVLLNSVTLRLEEEGVQVKEGIGFDELEIGPVNFVVRQEGLLKTEVLVESLRNWQTSLLDEKKIVLQASVPLLLLIEEPKADNLVNLLSDASYICETAKSSLLRVKVYSDETNVLRKARESVSDYLNKKLMDYKLPSDVQNFLKYQWAEVLFDRVILQGVECESWQDLDSMLSTLLDSISPIKSEMDNSEAGKQKLTQEIPVLIKVLREELEFSGYIHADTVDFFESLKKLHLSNLQGKLNNDDRSRWQAVSFEQSIPEYNSWISEKECACYEKLQVVLS